MQRKFTEWKHWHYWERGASIAVVVCLFFLLFQESLVPRMFYYQCGIQFCLNPVAGFILHVYQYTIRPLTMSPAGLYLLDHQAWLNILSIGYYFIFGSFIGLVYGRSVKRHGPLQPMSY